MGWKRRGSKPIDITFKFDSQKTFQRANIFISNRLDLGIQVFKRAKIFFSEDGVNYDGQQPITFEYMADRSIQESRNVSISLKNSRGRYVKMQLTFANVWLLVSEITFSTGDWIEGIAADLQDFEFDATTQKGWFDQNESPVEQYGTEATDPQESEGTEDTIKQVESASEDNTHLEIIIGVLTAVSLLLLFLFILFFMYSRRQKYLSSPSSRSLNPFPVQMNMKDLLMNLSPTSTPVMANGSLIQLPNGPSPVMPNITSNPNYTNDSNCEVVAETSTTSYYASPFQKSILSAPMLEDSRNKWYSTGHVPGPPGNRSSTFKSGHRNKMGLPSGSEYASVDVQDITQHGLDGNYRSLQQPHLQNQIRVHTKPKPSKVSQQQAIYNLGNYFPRISSEPPQRKQYREQDIHSEKAKAKLPNRKGCANLNFNCRSFRLHPRAGT